MNRKWQLMLIIGAALTVVVALVWFAATRSPAPEPTPQIIEETESPAPSLSAEDQRVLDDLSRQLGGKYFTYTSPSSDAYLGSIRPYVSDQFFQIAVQSNAKAAGQDISPIASTVSSVNFENTGEETAKTIVGLQTTERGTTYAQTITIYWEKTGGRWVAIDILRDSSERPEALDE